MSASSAPGDGYAKTGSDLPCAPHDGDAAETKVGSDDELQQVYEELEQHWGRCVGLYIHGSTIFLNKEPKDLDMLAIVDQAKLPIDSGSKEAQFVIGRCEVSVFERSFWLKRLEAMDLTMLTCISTPKRFVPMEFEDERVRSLKISPDVLEESVASYAEYTWLKAQRKIDRLEDLYAGAKNFYFAFRILAFGCQALDHGWIPDLRAARDKYVFVQQVMESLAVQHGEWDILEAVFSRLFQEAIRQFSLKVDKARGAKPADPEEETEEDPGDACGPWPCALCTRDAAPLRWPEEGRISDEALLSSGVRLANCQHCFHVDCIVNAIRDTARSKKGGAVCPICQKKVRTVVNKQRAYGMWASRPEA